MQRTKTMLAILACALALAACGLKGPLYLPGEEPPSEPASEQGVDDTDTNGNAARG